MAENVFVIDSAVMSSYWLDEMLNLLGKIGCILSILGSVIVIIHSPKEQEVQTIEEFVAKMQDHGQCMVPFSSPGALVALW